MLRRLAVCAAAALALVLVPPALAGGPQIGVMQGGDGVEAQGGAAHWTTLPGFTETQLVEIRRRDGAVLRSTAIPGRWGLALVAYDGSTGGLARDGRTIVLGDASPQTTPLRRVSRFVVVDTTRMRIRGSLELRGDFAFDALSPDGSRLYLIQHVSSANLSRYVVRAVDLRTDSLLPGRIADRTQRGWTMQGYPQTRTTSAGGRWVYTLYQNPGGYPFVHALDTVRGVAHCVGIPWSGDQGALYNIRLTLRDGGRTLALAWRSGRPYRDVDTASWRVTAPAAGGFPWWLAGLAGGAALLVLGESLRRARRRLRARAAAGSGPNRAPRAARPESA